MLINFFYALRSAKLKVSVKEYLTLLEALRAGVIDTSVDQFYYLARTALVKDEAQFDKFDRAFAAYFKGVELLTDFTQDVPLEWLRKTLELELSPEEKAAIEKMGWDELMETLKKRFEEQKERHEGGNRMIGTGGTSPFGAYGYNPQGIRIGQDKGRNKSAVKVWDQRQYKDYDDTLELGTRNIKVALRRLRRFAREGAEEELDGNRGPPLCIWSHEFYETDPARERVMLQNERGKRFEFRPGQMRPQGEQDPLRLFEVRPLEIHDGDRIRWTATDHKRGLLKFKDDLPKLRQNTMSGISS